MNKKLRPCSLQGLVSSLVCPSYKGIPKGIDVTYVLRAQRFCKEAC